jgi:hypothetical protein
MNTLLKLMLKGSVVSAMALTMAAVGCSDSDKEKAPGAGGDDGKGGSNAQAGETSKSGSTNGGDSSNVGGGGAKADGGAAGDGGAKSEGGAAGNGGAEAGGSAGEGGSGGASDGNATAKFCNTLEFDPDQDPETDNSVPATLILQVGEGADAVTFTAITGQCVPADGVACKVVPAGPDVLVQLFNATAPTVAVDAAPLEILDGERLLFFSDLDDDNAAIWNVAAANEGVTCEELTYDDVPGTP